MKSEANKTGTLCEKCVFWQSVSKDWAVYGENTCVEDSHKHHTQHHKQYHTPTINHTTMHLMNF